MTKNAAEQFPREAATSSSRDRRFARFEPTQEEKPSLIGAMKGSVLRYDDPISPVGENDWDAAR